MRYKVKYENSKKEICFGIFLGKIIDHGSPEEDVAKDGYVWIEGAINGEIFEVLAKSLEDIPNKLPVYDRDFEKMISGNEFDLFVYKEFQRELENSKKVGKGFKVGKIFSTNVADGEAWYIKVGKCFKVGKIFSTNVADGEAWYIITKVNKTMISYEWRCFSLDRWVDPMLGYNESIKKVHLNGYIQSADFEQGYK